MGNKESIAAKHRHASGESSNSMYAASPLSEGRSRYSTTTPPSTHTHHPRHYSESEGSTAAAAARAVANARARTATTSSGNHLTVSPTPVDSHHGRVFMPPEPDTDVEFDPEKFGQKTDHLPRFRTSTISEGTRIDNKKLPSVFKWDGHGVKEVFLVGSFNSWKAKIPLRKSQDNFYTIVDLPEGEHEYKFLVDGQWKHNESQPHRPNQYGSHNNTITVKKTDFEVLEALAIDSNNTAPTTTATTPATGNFDRPEEFHQRIPPKLSLEKGNPPTLPPHLLQVILNKETSEEYDPSLLPEPNHVMLNHLYALSIKDNVLVLSATHRYRKRFVTTLFYKPINS